MITSRRGLTWAQLAIGVSLWTGVGGVSAGATSRQTVEIPSICMDFELTSFAGDDSVESQTCSGKVYHRPHGLTLIRVDQPMHQWFRIEGESVLLYYPDERRVFRLPAFSAISHPLLHALEVALDTQPDLERRGFVALSTDVSDDSLRTCWKPPESLVGQLDRLCVTFVRDLMSEEVLLDPRDQVLERRRYSDYVTIGPYRMPLGIDQSAEVPRSSGGRFRLSNPVLDPDILKLGISTDIPPDISIEELIEP